MSRPLEVIKYEKGLTGYIYNDEDPINPRENDNLCIMIFFHKRYSLGDKDHGFNSNDYEGWEELRKSFEKKHGKCLSMPVYMYDHSGLTIATHPFSCPWDSGRIGTIFLPELKLRHDYGWKKLSTPRRKKGYDIINSEIQEYDMYLQGDVYGIILRDRKEDIIDSCWGFYGLSYAKDELKQWVEHYLRRN